MLDGAVPYPRTQYPGFQTHWSDLPTGAPPRSGLARWVRLLIKVVCLAYLRVFHDFRFRYHPDLPRGRSYIALISHTSALDVPCLLAADPYDPPTTMVIKSEMVRAPLLGKILRAWGAIAVDRRGQDIHALRQIRKVLTAGQGICVAPSGTRSEDGRRAGESGPGAPDPPERRTGVSGGDRRNLRVHVASHELPRPGKVYLDAGAEIDLSRFRGRRLTATDIEDAARTMRDGLAAMLPESMRPLPETPILGAYTLEG